MKVLIFLPSDEERAMDVLTAGSRLAEDLQARVCVVHVHPAGRTEAVRDPRHESLARRFKADSCQLDDGASSSALLRLARQQRADHLILGPRAWLRWGEELRDAGEAGGDLALCWVLPGAGIDCLGLSFETAQRSHNEKPADRSDRRGVVGLFGRLMASFRCRPNRRLGR